MWPCRSTLAPNWRLGVRIEESWPQLGRIDGWWNEKSKIKIKTVPLTGDSSRGVEDAFQSFRRQRLWRESRCLRIARDFLSLTGPSLLSRGTHHILWDRKMTESLGHPPMWIRIATPCALSGEVDKNKSRSSGCPLLS